LNTIIPSPFSLKQPLAALALLWISLFSAGATNQPDRPILVFDVWKFFEQERIDGTLDRVDFLYFLTALQGIANRDRPRLYLLVSLSLFDLEARNSTAKKEEIEVTELDAFWLRYLIASGDLKETSIRRTSSLSEVLAAFRNHVRGLAVWEMKVPATVNAALTAASARDLLPVSADLGTGRLQKWIEANARDLRHELDFTGQFRPLEKGKSVSVFGTKFDSSGSAKTDVYRYIHEAFLKTRKVSPFYMYYNSDAIMWGERRHMYDRETYGHLGDRNELQQNGMFNNDYWVAKRGLFVELYVWDDQAPNDDPSQPVGADAEAWNDILETGYAQRKGEFGIVGGFVPWWIKYVDKKHAGVPTEWRFVELMTSYNMGNDADAGFGLSNASFFMHMPAIARQAIPDPPKTFPKLTADTVYLSFFMLDYDGSAWLNQAAEAVYEAGGRGRLPLNWTINPVLNDRVPHAFRFMVENRTELDFFGIEGDGASYISPLRLVEGHRLGRIKESGIPYYERYARKYHDRFGVGITAFYITPKYDPAWGKMAARLTPTGFGVNIPVPVKQVEGTPVVMLPHFHARRIPALQDFLDTIYRNNQERQTGQILFQPLRCILIPPYAIADAVESARKKYPRAKVEVVDAFTFFRLRRESLPEPDIAHP